MSTEIGFVKLKLNRASEHITSIEKAISAYTRSSDSYEVRQDEEGKEKIHIIRKPPPDISILSGEAVYQLRSALDQLAFILVKFNARNVALPNGWERRCAFPLLIEVPKNYTLPVSHAHFEKTLPGITRQAYEFIESLQPYRNRNAENVGAPNRWLGLLAKLSKIDKHRHSHLTVTRIRKDELVRFNGGTERRYWHIVNSGAELEQTVRTDSQTGRSTVMERSLKANRNVRRICTGRCS